MSKEWNVYFTGQEYVVITTKASTATEALANAKKVVDNAPVAFPSKPYTLDKIRRKA
jgi:ketopantoate reductase